MLDARKLAEKYGVPHYNVHVSTLFPSRPLLMSMHFQRGELHRIMYNAVKGIADIRINSRVTSVAIQKAESETIQPTITLADGRQFSADLVVGADGVKSVIRKYVCADPIGGHKTNSAYR